MTTVQAVDVPESPVPAVLYKYLPPERIDILENLELRFSRPFEFYDTFDTHYLEPMTSGRARYISLCMLNLSLANASETEKTG